MINKVEIFLKSSFNNEYLSDEMITIYVRKSKRYIDGKFYHFLDLATINVVEEYRNKGVFTNFLTELLKNFPDKNIFVESIFNEHLVNKLKKFNFKEQRLNEYQLNMFLIKDSN